MEEEDEEEEEKCTRHYGTRRKRCKCTVGGRIGWIVTRSGTSRRPGKPGTTTKAVITGRPFLMIFP